MVCKAAVVIVKVVLEQDQQYLISQKESGMIVSAQGKDWTKKDSAVCPSLGYSGVLL